jgi:hypothetical protein
MNARLENMQVKTVPPKIGEDGATERLQIVATKEWVKRLDDWRRRHPDLPNRSAAIRMLVEDAIDAEAKATG